MLDPQIVELATDQSNSVYRLVYIMCLLKINSKASSLQWTIAVLLISTTNGEYRPRSRRFNI